MAFRTQHTFALAFGLLISFLLTSCSTPQSKPEEQKPTQTAETKQSEPDDTKQLEAAILEAKNHQAWSKYIDLNHQLWQQADDANQLAIEYQTWKTLSNLTEPEQNQLTEQAHKNGNIDMLDWLALVKTTQQHPIWQPQALTDLQEFHPEAIYNKHLIEALQYRLQNPLKTTHIAVMLPSTGTFAGVSQQIRNGILKNHFQHQQNLRIDFYDSSQLDQIKQTYQQAINNGAEWVIGPLRKEAIATLAELKPNNVIALNQVKNISTPQFSFKSPSEAQQIKKQMCSQGYRRIGILSSTSTSDTKLAEQIAITWNQSPQNQAILKTYPQKRPNLRKALGSVINEAQSDQRAANLRWLLDEKIEYKARTRQDLDAILLIGYTNRVSVFRPQFKFFELQLPTYATSKITPNKLYHTPANKDLRRVIFPSMPAALSPSDLQTPFEAFGWDSLTLVMEQQKLAPGLCINAGKTGRLSKTDNRFDHQFEWAQFNQIGQAQPLNHP